jgi:hypothetical protein
VHSEVSGCAGSVGQGAAVWAASGSGPYALVDDTLSGSESAVIVGGAAPMVTGQVPSDLVIRGSHLTRPLSWKGTHYSHTLLDLRSVARALVEGNVFDNNWAEREQGFALQLGATTAVGPTPWASVRDVTLRYNVVRDVESGVSIKATASGSTIPLERVDVFDNLFHGVGVDATVAQVVQLTGDLHLLEIVHNTLTKIEQPTGECFFLAGSGAATGIHVVDNITGSGQPNGAIIFDATPDGVPALTAFSSDYRFAGNVVYGLDASWIKDYPTENFYPLDLTSVGFANVSGGDYALSSSSLYHAAATDGSDPGANIPALRTLTTGVDR